MYIKVFFICSNIDTGWLNRESDYNVWKFCVFFSNGLTSSLPFYLYKKSIQKSSQLFIINWYIHLIISSDCLNKWSNYFYIFLYPFYILHTFIQYHLYRFIFHFYSFCIFLLLLSVHFFYSLHPFMLLLR